ncbi:hypothetical protein CAEBREN_08729 [Caenorhabditis brenneri]|uniref:Uncharacterized protein n=1 Tax=Caenorhabditis brenneri TaxID=135651 RepID=G0MIK2_CAEBE|nr:hypothetical protein CAEBREN_08729 [Caenorhabditis brenneri]
MNRRTLCILFVLVACFSIAFAIPEDEEIKQDQQNAEGGTRNEKNKEMRAKDAAEFKGSATLKTPENDEKKTDESATPAKAAPAIDSFFTIGALTMATVYIV